MQAVHLELEAKKRTFWCPQCGHILRMFGDEPDVNEAPRMIKKFLEIAPSEQCDKDYPQLAAWAHEVRARRVKPPTCEGHLFVYDMSSQSHQCTRCGTRVTNLDKLLEGP